MESGVQQRCCDWFGENFVISFFDSFVMATCVDEVCKGWSVMYYIDRFHWISRYVYKCSFFHRSTVIWNHISSPTTTDTRDIRDFTQLGRELQRKRYKTIVLITEYNEFTWQSKQLASFSSSSSVNRTWKAQLCGFLENVNNKAWII